MVTLVGLARTLRTTRRPHVVLLMRFSAKRKLVTFSNGFKFRLIWSQFRTLRDSYSVMQGYSVEQVENDLFKVKSGEFELVASLPIVCVIAELRQEYEVEQVEKSLFKIKCNRFELLGTSEILDFIREMQLGEYDCDCRGKVVLDVGGFQGESAVFFSANGAKKVIVYEPILAHHAFIKKNVSLNRVNAEIHEAGIGAVDGRLDSPADGDIKIRNVASVISESGASVAKIDCEGAEESFIHVPSEILRKIELYMIEVHTPEIKKALIKKFRASGFCLEKDRVKNKQLSVIFFRRI